MPTPRCRVQDAASQEVRFPELGKNIELAERSGDGMKLGDRQALELAIEMGRGAIWLELTEEQYRRLQNE